jgi:hypothetical protein
MERSIYKKKETRNVGKEVWKFMTISVVSLLIGGVPGYFLIGPNKPTKNEVSAMIKKEAPLAIRQELKEIELTQKSIEIEIAKQSVQISQILEAVKR